MLGVTACFILLEPLPCLAISTMTQRPALVSLFGGVQCENSLLGKETAVQEYSSALDGHGSAVWKQPCVLYQQRAPELTRHCHTHTHSPASTERSRKP